MPDRGHPASDRVTHDGAADTMGASHTLPAAAPAHARVREDAVLCDRCGTEMFRMHAVWRCPACGYKTDCCGW